MGGTQVASQCSNLGAKGIQDLGVKWIQEPHASPDDTQRHLQASLAITASACMHVRAGAHTHTQLINLSIPLLCIFSFSSSLSNTHSVIFNLSFSYVA